ncbi:MAG: YceI family protein [Phycisphaerales bacterium]|nr:YceI family protein [Phycisphaerales bacterium]
MFKFLVAGVLVVSSFVAVEDAADTPVAPVETWELDTVHSMALFRVQHVGAGQFWGRFNDVTGSVDWPRDDSVAPELDVSIAIESVDTGNEKLDRHLKSPDFFNGREFETATFRSTGAERVGDRQWRVRGDMTMLGQTRPVTAELEVTGVRGNPVQAKAGWEAIFTIKRSEFGMNWGVENGALGDEVKIIVGLEGNIEPGR